MCGVRRVNKVTTISTCGRCGAVEVQEGAHGSAPPDGWATGRVTRHVRFEGLITLFDDALCPACQDAVMAGLKPVSSGYLTPFPAGYGDEGYQGQAEAPDAD